MLIRFYLTLREHGIAVSLTELFNLYGCLQAGYAFADTEAFYRLARICLVKDEKHFDKYDKAFAAFFEQAAILDKALDIHLPEEWLRREFEAALTDEERAMIEQMGGLDAVMEAFRERLQEQKERHQGGNQWIGTGGTSPFGGFGYNPAGIRIGQPEGREGRAIKVWEKRQFQDLDDSVEIGTRNIKMALRRLRKFARSGAEQELDVNDTIRSTASKGGLLDIKMVPERHNAVKVLLFFDIGGSMDPYVHLCEDLFSAAKTEFKHMEYYYFHNFIYESVWKKSRRRHTETTPLFDVIHKYGSDYKIIFVGDATMAPYEITEAGGSIEHYNEEPGAVWMQRMTEHFDKVAWINPVNESYWRHGYSIGIVRELIENRMFPMTVTGLESAMSYLAR